MDDKNNQVEQKGQSQEEKRSFKIQKDNSNSYFNYPASDNIGARSSTVARAMASTLMPRIGASKDKKQPVCVYCGQDATHLDHLFPFIKGKKPTGYFTEPANLVPCCSNCNQKKGAKYWYEYMMNKENFENHQKKEDIIERIPELMKKMNNYCFDNGFPSLKTDEEGEIIIKEGQVIETKPENEKHRLELFNSSATIDRIGIEEWWNGLYHNVICALDSAQIQIDAFNAGIILEYTSENQNEEQIKGHFSKYFKRFWEDIKNKNDENKVKYQRLIDLGFDENGEYKDDNGSKSKAIYESAEFAYRLGYEYAIEAKQEEKEILHSSIVQMSQSSRWPKKLTIAGFTKNTII